MVGEWEKTTVNWLGDKRLMQYSLGLMAVHLHSQVNYVWAREKILQYCISLRLATRCLSWKQPSILKHMYNSIYKFKYIRKNYVFRMIWFYNPQLAVVLVFEQPKFIMSDKKCTGIYGIRYWPMVWIFLSSY